MFPAPHVVHRPQGRLSTAQHLDHVASYSLVWYLLCLQPHACLTRRNQYKGSHSQDQQSGRWECVSMTDPSKLGHTCCLPVSALRLEDAQGRGSVPSIYQTEVTNGHER